MLRSVSPPILSLHGVVIYIARDRAANCIADCDRARIVHAAPDSRVVTVGTRLPDAGIRAVRLSRRRERERLSVVEASEKNARGRPVETGMSGRIFRVGRRSDERYPGYVGNRARVTIGVCQRDGGDRLSCHFRRILVVEVLGVPDGQSRIGHRDVQHREQAVGAGDRKTVDARNLVCRRAARHTRAGLGSIFTAEVKEAWTVAYTVLASTMQQGATAR